ncbi:MAG: hypothetical protein ACM3O3_00805 [Syntrophothermus sp.]
MKIFLSMSILFIVLISGCNKENDALTSPGEHFKPVSWLFNDVNNNVLLAINDDKILPSWEGLSKDTLFNLPFNNTQFIKIVFLDNGNNILIPPSDLGYQLGWEIEDTTKVTITGGSDKYSFNILSKNIGQTRFQLFVLHAGQKDAMTPFITIWIK